MSVVETSSDLAELRRAARADPRNGVLRFLLAAELAHAHDYEGAVLEFSAAIALDPSLDVARFQLGLLHVTLTQTDHALTVLAPLENLADDNPLKHFQRGLVALMREDMPGFLQAMQHGIELKPAIPALQRDMQMLVDHVCEARKTADSGHAAVGVHTDFSLYGIKH